LDVWVDKLVKMVVIARPVVTARETLAGAASLFSQNEIHETKTTR
jgi:hypothetical protein